jgi:S1-C subfamily serine protease
MAAGDIIIAVAGKPVDSVARLLARLDDFAVGDVVQIGLLRGGQRHTVTVTLQAEN